MCFLDENLGCNGGFPNLAFTYIKENGGIDTEVSYPYTGQVTICNNICIMHNQYYTLQNGTCQYNPENIGANCTGYFILPSGDEDTLLSTCYSIGPISVLMDASGMNFQV